MTDEGRRQENEAAEDPGDRATLREAGGAAGDDSAVHGTPEDGNGSAAGKSAAPDGASAPAEFQSTDGGAAEPGTGEDGATAGAGPSGAGTAGLELELAEARRTAAEHLDRALRAQAEVENVRRRLERDLQNAHKFALERFVSELLPVKDSLELGLAAAADKGASTAGIAQGVELTLRMLEQAMEKFGVSVVDPAGEPFDPEFHQAMTLQESDTAESGTVLTVVQKGYLLNDRLVRAAMVIVAK